MTLRAFALSMILPVCLAGCVAQTGAAPDLGASTATFAPTAEDKQSLAYKACRAAIAEQTGRPLSDVKVFDYLFAEANTQVQAHVTGADAPWRCLSSTRGEVAEVSYTGSEGAL